MYTATRAVHTANLQTVVVRTTAATTQQRPWRQQSAEIDFISISLDPNRPHERVRSFLSGGRLCCLSSDVGAVVVAEPQPHGDDYCCIDSINMIVE